MWDGPRRGYFINYLILFIDIHNNTNYKFLYIIFNILIYIIFYFKLKKNCFNYINIFRLYILKLDNNYKIKKIIIYII